MLGDAVIVEGAAAPAIDLPTAKGFLRLDGTEFDVELQIHLSAAIADVERISGTRLTQQVVEITADSFTDLECLSPGPVVDALSLSYTAPTGTTVTIEPAAYELTGANLRRGLIPAAGQRWPSRSRSIKATLRVGYDVVPDNIIWAVLGLTRAKLDGVRFDVAALLVNDRIWS